MKEEAARNEGASPEHRAQNEGKKNKHKLCLAVRTGLFVLGLPRENSSRSFTGLGDREKNHLQQHHNPGQPRD